MLAGVLFINVNRVFDHMSRSYLLCSIESMGLDGDRIRWTESFISNRSVGIILNRHQYIEVRVETG